MDPFRKTDGRSRDSRWTWGDPNRNRQEIDKEPNKFIEKLTFPLLNAEIRFSKSMNFEQINEYRGFKQRIGTNSGSITLILGAGNVSSIPFLDTIFHLVANRSSIILKLNPVNDYLNPVFQKVFHEFIERGFKL